MHSVLALEVWGGAGGGRMQMGPSCPAGVTHQEFLRTWCASAWSSQGVSVAIQMVHSQDMQATDRKTQGSRQARLRLVAGAGTHITFCGAVSLAFPII